MSSWVFFAGTTYPDVFFVYFVPFKPGIKIPLHLINRHIYLLPKGNRLKFIEYRFMELFTDTIGLRALGLGLCVIDMIEC